MQTLLVSFPEDGSVHVKLNDSEKVYIFNWTSDSELEPQKWVMKDEEYRNKAEFVSGGEERLEVIQAICDLDSKKSWVLPVVQAAQEELTLA